MLLKTFNIVISFGPDNSQRAANWARFVLTHETVSDILSTLEAAGGTKLETKSKVEAEN